LGKVYIVKAKAMSFPIRNCKSVIYKDNHKQKTRGLHMDNLARCGSQTHVMVIYIYFRISALPLLHV